MAPTATFSLTLAEDDLPLIGEIDAADDIIQSRLPAAVRADDAYGFPFLNLEVYAIDGNQTPKSFC
jgi:hypothetical protein